MSLERYSKYDARVIKIIADFPASPDEPITVKTVADHDDDPKPLTYEQVRRCVKKLHDNKRLARFGTSNGWREYIRTRKPLPTITASIQRLYKQRLDRRSARDYTFSGQEIAREVSKTVIAALRHELRPRGQSSRSPKTTRPLPLFPDVA